MKKPLLLLSIVLASASVSAQTAVQAWAQHYHGQAGNVVYGMAVDGDGNVFVTGKSGTVAYSGKGMPLWTNAYSAGYAIAVDNGGNVLVARADFATIKLSAAGFPLWTNRYHGPRNIDTANAIAVDSTGNVYVTGTSLNASTNNEYATVAYSGAGMALWTNRYHYSSPYYDAASAIVVGANGQVYVTGTSLIGYGSGADYATVAYSAAGVPLWTNRYDGPARGNDHAYAIAVDTNGNAYVTGASSLLGVGAEFNYYQYATVAYSSGGQTLWVNFYHGLGDFSSASPSAIAADSGGNMFVTGKVIGETGGGVHYSTVAYSASACFLWTNHYYGPATPDAVSAIAVDSTGNVYVAGASARSPNINGFATVAYSGGGIPLWTNRYDGPTNTSAKPTAIAVDRSGNVFVTGNLWDSTNSEYLTIKYATTQKLNYQYLDHALVLSWPLTNLGFALQSAPALSGSFTNIPGASSPYTNSVSGQQQLFRLISN